MTGRVVIVTGADRGIGFETARYLAAEGGYDVVLACRDQDKGLAAVQRIKRENPSALASFMQVDLSATTSIKHFVTHFTMKKRKLHILVNNAAVKLSEHDLTVKPTLDKIEITMATNHVGPFLLTNLLLDLLVTAGHMTGDARIVNVVCSEHDHTNIRASGITPLEMDNFQLQKPGSFNGLQAYKNSKLCNVLMTYYLAQTLTGTGVFVNCVDPGKCPSTGLDSQSNKISRGMNLFCLHYLLRCAKITKTKRQAGKMVANLACSDQYRGVTGRYFVEGEQDRSSIESYDHDLQEAVWNRSRALAGLHKDDGLDDISLGGNL